MIGAVADLALRAAVALLAVVGVTDHLQSPSGMAAATTGGDSHEAAGLSASLPAMYRHGAESWGLDGWPTWPALQQQETSAGRRLGGSCSNATLLQAAMEKTKANQRNACRPCNVEVDTSFCYVRSGGTPQEHCDCVQSSCTCRSLGDACALLFTRPGRYGSGNNFWWGLLLAFLERAVWLLLELLVAACLWRGVREAGQMEVIPQLTADREFESGLCSCFEDCGTCCCGLWCPTVLSAKTLHAANVTHFWRAMLIFCVAFIWPYVGYWLFAIAVLAYRMELRRRAGLQEDACCDCLSVFFCTPCAICQQARHVKKAMATMQQQKQQQQQAELTAAAPSAPTAVGAPVLLGTAPAPQEAEK